MGTAYHRINITTSDELILCAVEITQERNAIPISEGSIREADMTLAEVLGNVSKSLQEQVSQWVYVQRGLRLFDGPHIYIYKSPRLIDWTRTQAINDAGDIIGQVLSNEISDNGNS